MAADWLSQDGGATAGRLNGCSALPSASRRSSTPTTLAVSGVGFCTFNANRSGLFWSPIRSRSSNPFVMNSVTSAPFSSSNALVPRVVARCMVREGSGLDAIVPVARRAARIGASMLKTISIAWPGADPSGNGLAKRSDCSVDCSVIAMGSVAWQSSLSPWPSANWAGMG